MARVLLIEDEDEKAKSISSEICVYFGETVRIDRCSVFAEVAKAIFEVSYDLIVADLILPRRCGEETEDFSEDLLDYLSSSSKNTRSVVVAISRYPDLVDQRRDAFARKAIFLLFFDSNGSWRSCLNICMQKVKQNISCDFVILCALEEERAAFRKVSGVSVGELSNHRGLDCRGLQIEELNGICIVQPRMGLVDATAMTALVLSEFRPKVLAMAGVCAGFESEVSLGTLVISDPCWEHQAGKWIGNEFQMRHFQQPLDHFVRTQLSQMISRDTNLSRLRYGLERLSFAPDVAAVIAPSVSGSAVIASEGFAKEIAEQHGKVSALDMEVFGVYRAAALYSDDVKVFAAKTVVDFANEGKGDDVHADGACLSARFVCLAVAELLRVSGNSRSAV